MANCSAGACAINCPSLGCVCIGSSKDPDDCQCECTLGPDITKPGYKASNVLLKGGKQIPINKNAHRIKVTLNGRYDICVKSMPITQLAQFFNKLLPNSILVPASLLTKNVTFSLKNKTFRKIIIASGLAIKS